VSHRVPKTNRERVPAPKSGPLRARLGGVAALLFALGAAIYVVRRREVFDGGEALEPQWLVVALAAETALLGMRALILRRLCRIASCHLGGSEAAGLVAWSSLASYIAPVVGGGALRAAYLKRRHGLSYAAYLGVFGSSFALVFGFAAALGLTVLAGSELVTAPARWWLLAGFAAVVVAAAMLLAWPFPLPRGDGRLPTTLAQVTAVWKALRAPDFAFLTVLATSYLAAAGLSTGATFATVGWPLTPQGALLVTSLGELSLLLNVTPGGVGVLETALAAGGALLSVPLAAALVAGGFRRIAALVVTALTAVIAQPLRGG